MASTSTRTTSTPRPPTSSRCCSTSLGRAAAPDERFNYSSGTSNIISGLVASTVDDYGTFLRERLFDRIGMRSATPKFDDAGTWIASSFLYATAQDWARFGYLYLR